MKKVVLIFLQLFIAHFVFSQTNYLISTYNGQTVNTCTGKFYDSGGATGNYGANENYSMTICSNSATNTHIHLYFWAFDIDASDTLLIYDGPSAAAPLIGKYNNNNTLFYYPIDASITNTSGCLFLKFKSNGLTQAAGWYADISCMPVCQSIVATMDSVAMTPHPKDSAYINICFHDTITFVAKGVYPQNGMVYSQSDATSTFLWNFGDGATSNLKTVKHYYSLVRGYNVTLTITDIQGCISSNALGARVRISRSPVGHVGSLPDICSGSQLSINVGYSSMSTINVTLPSFYQAASLTFDSASFIPDGGALGGVCYNQFVTFNCFNPGQTVVNASDVVSCCVNMEHSYVGDLEMSLRCPNGQATILKAYIHSGYSYLGFPYMAPNDQAGDCMTTPACEQDPLQNPPGIGYNYCWTLNSPSYGIMNNYANSGSMPVPPTTVPEIDSSSYLPDGNWTTLIGCPLNGTWNFRVCDYWAIDNGWVFSWTLNLDPSILPTNWGYTVPIDNLTWTGPDIIAHTATSITIAPQIGGLLHYVVHIMDHFGCVYDTVATVNVVETPKFTLGPDTAMCEGTPFAITAPTYANGTYYWLPNGDTSKTISVTQSNTYIAIVQTGNANVQCIGTDTINVAFNPVPMVSFGPDIFFGCEPITVQFMNATSPSTSTFFWDLGDGTTTNMQTPTHTYPAGNYTITLTATTNKGCHQTYTIPNLIRSFPHPHAKFDRPLLDHDTIKNLSDPSFTFQLLTPTATLDTPYRFIWTFGDGTIDASNNFSPTHLYNAKGVYDVWLYFSTSHGCMDSIMKRVYVIDDELTIPNVITPNGDGTNDYFVIKNLDSYPTNELTVFDRWGKKIYDRPNYRNDWDGGNNADGTYFYILRCKGLVQDQNKRGSLTIIGKQ